MRFVYHPLSSVVLAVAVWLGLLPIRPMLQDADRFLLEAGIILGASAATGLLLGLLRAPRALTLPLQLGVVVAVLVWRGLSLAPPGELLPALQELTNAGVIAVQSGVPPLPPDDGLMWLCLLLTALLIVVVEFLVNGLEQPAWSIAPLALVFGVSALILTDDLPWLHFLPVALGYLAVLLTVTGVGGQREAVASQPADYHASRLSIAAVFAAAALAVSFFVAPALPLGEQQKWDQAGTDGPIQLSDPTVRLDEDLRRPGDKRILSYRTSNDQPVYLRTVALPELTSAGARLLPMRLARTDMADAYEYPGEEIEIEIEMDAVPSEYLPVPFAVESIDAEGSWSYDPETMSVVASGDERLQQTVRLSYRAVSTLPSPSREDIEAAGIGTGLEPVTSVVPDGVTPEVRALTAEVVSGAQTAGQKALAIQEFLRSDDFSYDDVAPVAGSTDTVSSFLLSERSGYCIHFAAAMITMARIEGIDARMAVGFVPGERQEDGSYEVTAHDAHAWPELFLDGLGWVPFEPSPAFDGPPGYTDPAAEPTPDPAPTESPSPSEEPADPEPSAAPTPSETPAPPAADEDQGGAAPWGLLGLGVLVALAAPGGIRAVQRAVRLRSGQSPDQAADGAWREVQALMTDFGHAWPEGSPGPAARSMAAGLPPQGASALTSVATAVERSRYARGGSQTDELSGEVKSLRRSLSESASTGTKFRAVALPPSLWRKPS